MTLFTLNEEGRFSEFKKKKEKSDVKELDLFSLVEKNPGSVLPDSNVLIIGKKILTDHDGTIDFLGTDKHGNTVVIDIQGKKAKSKSLFRLIENAAYSNTLSYHDLDAIFKDFEESGPNLTSTFLKYFDTEEEPQWDGDVKLVIVAQIVTESLVQTADFLRKNGLDIHIVTFNIADFGDNPNVISREFVVGGDKTVIETRIPDSVKTPQTDQERFFHSIDMYGHAVFSKLVEFAKEENLEFKWTSQGFSLNILINDSPIGLCYGYSQDSLMDQSIYTGFDQILKNVNNAEEIVAIFITRLEETNLFNKTRSSYRWNITEDFATDDIQHFLDVLKEIAEKIRENGLIKLEVETPLA